MKSLIGSRPSLRASSSSSRTPGHHSQIISVQHPSWHLSAPQLSEYLRKTRRNAALGVGKEENARTARTSVCACRDQNEFTIAKVTRL